MGSGCALLATQGRSLLLELGSDRFCWLLLKKLVFQTKVKE
ncbi:hypothetical protein [Nostoc sp. CCY 9925]